jgi:arginyl-tRNA synthetase
MQTHPKVLIADLFSRALASVAPDLSQTPIVLERPRQALHGDFASNLALQLAKPLRRNPRELAQLLVSELPFSPLIEKVEVAGPGFINITLTQVARAAIVPIVLNQGAQFGQGDPKNERVLLEYVSANPTGPLHVGHGRGAAYGASLAKVLSFAGYTVHREYYVNDAGRQMDILALSTWLRYLSLEGIDLPFPPNAYQGHYVIQMAMALRAQHGKRFLPEGAWAVLEGVPNLPDPVRQDEEAKALREHHLDALIARAKALLKEDYHWVHGFALNEQLSDCREDLEGFGVSFDQWFSEQSLFGTGLVAHVVEKLEERGHLYIQNGARWFRASQFGDEKDRVVQRENGFYTYFASDIAYHVNKLQRGFDRLIDVWGADHHGYIPRVKAALTALGWEASRLEVALVQFAVLYRDGKKASMSTRSGEFVTLRSLREEVGNDACRFFYVLRKSDQHLDFDLDLARSQTNENPVYYIQYAYARASSVIRQWGQALSELNQADIALLTTEQEAAVCAALSAFPEIVEQTAQERAPHLVAFYLKDLAALFHSNYNAHRMLVEDAALSTSRVALAQAVRQTLRNGLNLLGVCAPETM